MWAEARIEGRVDEARNLLRIGLRAKLPKLEQLRRATEALVENVFRSDDERWVHAAIVSTASAHFAETQR